MKKFILYILTIRCCKLIFGRIFFCLNSYSLTIGAFTKPSPIQNTEHSNQADVVWYSATVSEPYTVIYTNQTMYSQQNNSHVTMPNRIERRDERRDELVNDNRGDERENEIDN
ncbi:hypothetical protein EDEG_02635 [Edhazardia aedis USNM 41457]|uniref:Uncharacterized protein n=1 Tax=Edhazardia aedis (strain USNM 41457) TaxID=1003232 RepID=J9D5B4_EDHAE|nr:hypothetical protein EDEG_02635 [Edhazardia aedis USNM 41457]|eukprot:EJW02991.1 hypothetical protein EDEG_02635 [Edhazardia aedis USNM 41457]